MDVVRGRVVSVTGIICPHARLSTGQHEMAEAGQSVQSSSYLDRRIIPVELHVVIATSVSSMSIYHPDYRTAAAVASINWSALIVVSWSFDANDSNEPFDTASHSERSLTVYHHCAIQWCAVRMGVDHGGDRGHVPPEFGV